MQYEKEIILKDGAKCLLRGANEADASEMLRTFNLTHTETENLDTMRQTGSVWIMIIMLAGTVLAVALSAFVGCKMFRKQFEKAGITK